LQNWIKKFEIGINPPAFSFMKISQANGYECPIGTSYFLEQDKHVL
jgi:hypothetical protein